MTRKRRTSVIMHPLPAGLPTMPDPCSGVPANPWCNGQVIMPAAAGCSARVVTARLRLAKRESLRVQSEIVAAAIAASASVDTDRITFDPDRLSEVGNTRFPFRDDGFAAFEEAGLDDAAALAATGRRYRHSILAMGGSRPPMEVFRTFRGREPSTAALLRHSGLAA